jgi:hypothetical protein
MRAFMMAFFVARATSIELVKTPHGLRPKSCVHEVPSETFVENSLDGMRHIYPNGSTRTFGPCLDAEKLNTADWASWPAMALGSATQLQTYFDAIYIVPGFPVRHTGGKDQTIHIWIGTEPSKGQDIMQPVLTWTIGNPDTWSISAWMMNLAGHSVHTGNTPGLKQGDQVQALVQLDSRCGNNCYYISAKSGSKSAVIQANGIEGTEVKAVTAVETWGENGDNCGALPSSEVVFNSMKTQPAQSFAPGAGNPWDVSQCGWHNKVEGSTWRTGPSAIVV